MPTDPQDRRYVESRSGVGTMSYEEISNFIGVTADPQKMEKPSGTPAKPDAGVSIGKI
jgi:hypothetical protein